MRVAKVSLESISPYGQSKLVEIPRLKNEAGNEFETYDNYEKRTWRERCHYSEKGEVYIPPMAFKNCISEGAKFLSIKIPGENKATYTKHFEAGIMVTDPLILPVKKDDIDGLWLFVPSNGRRGGTTRVKKCFPVVHSWKGDVNFYILDDKITENIFERVLKDSGNFIGIGFFRPRNNGFYGRFKVNKVQWSKVE